MLQKALILKNYNLERPFPKGEIKEVTRLMKDKLSGKK